MILVVTIVEGIVGAAISGIGETGCNQGEVFIETSVLATREVGLVIIRSDSITSVREFGLVITFKSVVAGADDVGGMETSPLVGSS